MKTTLSLTAQQTGDMIAKHVIALYQSNLTSQANVMNLEFVSIQKDVLTVKRFAEEIYTSPERYSQLTPIQLKKEGLGYYWEKPLSPETSNVGTNSSVQLTPDLLDRLARSKYLEPLFRQSLLANQNLVAMYYILPDNAWRIYPAINLKEEVDKKYFLPSIPITSYPFYTKALPTDNPRGDTIWTDPYHDVTHRDWMVTVSAPVFSKDHKVLGVVGADVTIENLVNNVLNTRFHLSNAYAFLMNKDGRIIAVQKEGAKDVNNLPLSQIVNDKGKEKVTDLGDHRVLLSAFIPATQWYLGYVIPRNEMISPIYDQTNQDILESGKRIINQLTVMSFFLVLLCVAITFVVWNRLMRPMRKLIAAFSEVSAGRLNIEMPENEIVEFNKVSQSFNRMSQQINHLVQVLDQRLQEKEILQQELLSLNRQLEFLVNKRTEELSKANETLLLKNRQLEEMENSRVLMLANISHDLKTPLTLISGYIDAICDGVIEKDQVSDYLEKIRHRVKSLNRLVRDLYELSLLETKNKALHYQNIKIGCFLDQVKEKWHVTHGDLLHAQAVCVFDHVSGAERDADISLDVEYMHRAIDNLIENAKKYGDKDKPILVNMYLKDRFLHLAVCDEGPGIDEEHLPYIFERSYRADKSRNSKIPGNGLGLAIVKEIVEAHQGKVWVESKINKGTIFTIRLPINTS
ncbi:hypothetical protein DNHGIG_06350 [Collibacillus ludicampi]|uniref:histidine kinase n=1 Tax=Collibacillus ludicampi TaxID=2771369 RepID=A0AAV4LBL9_9BACL|nr:hypothetical protein DNHGIG_06350 [Collibacillus ludicampi]